MVCDNEELLKWFKDWLEGKTERKSGSVVLYDLEYKEIRRWNFFRAFPCRWVGPKLDCRMRDTLAVERIEIAHEGLELDDAFAPDSQDGEASLWSKIADGVQAGLDVAGLVPGFGEIADGINALISLGRGDFAGSALSAASMVPVVGDVVGKGGKVLRAAAKHGDEISDTFKNIDKFQDTLDTIKKTGKAPDGYQGGRIFKNRGGDGYQVLPQIDKNGNPIIYTEWDVNPKVAGQSRGTERLVIGSDGSAWKTTDHYHTFSQME